MCTEHMFLLAGYYFQLPFKRCMPVYCQNWMILRHIIWSSGDFSHCPNSNEFISGRSRKSWALWSCNFTFEPEYFKHSRSQYDFICGLRAASSCFITWFFSALLTLKIQSWSTCLSVYLLAISLSVKLGAESFSLSHKFK